MASLVLLHGAVTGPAVWDRVMPLLQAALPDASVRALERPRTGSLATELDWLAAEMAGGEPPWVVGMSGGATLGLALAATAVPLAGAILHEPAVGSLAPGLLASVAAAFKQKGAVGLGRTLYGPSWRPAMAAGAATDRAAAELAMFRSFEPAPVQPSAGRVVVTVGAASPQARKDAANALVPLGCEVRVLADAHHFVAHDHPAQLADLVASLLA